MKKLLPVLIFGWIAVFSTSCAKQKLTKTWQVSQYKEDGEDKTSEFHLIFPGYQLTFFDNGDFEATAFPLGIETTLTGTWEFQDAKTKLKLDYDDQNEGTQVFDCHKLTSDELNVSRQTDKKEEIFLVAVD